MVFLPILGVAMGKGRWYNVNEQMFYFGKMIKLLNGEDGRIVRDENRTGQEIRKGDTLEKNDYIKHCLNEIQAIILRNDVMFAKKVLIRVINLEKILHK